MNQTLQDEINARVGNDSLKLDANDQRYNDTAFVINQLASYYNKTQVDALLANLNVTSNVTAYNDSGVLASLAAINASKLDVAVFNGENTTLWVAINAKLDANDSRHNDTAFIMNQLLNYYVKTDVYN